MEGSASLDDLEFNRALQGSEGVDVNYTSRIRIQYLTAQSTTLVTQTQFADAKAAALMTLSGLLMFRGPAGLDREQTPDFLLMLALIFNAACLVACILAIIPRFGPAAFNPKLYGSERFSWLSLSHPANGAGDYPEFMRTSEVSQLVLSQSRANQASAVVLRRKFRILRLAFILGICSVLAIGLEWLASAAGIAIPGF